MSQQNNKCCVPPCSHPMSELDTHTYCFVCLGKNTLPLHLSMVIASTVECSQLKCFTFALLISNGVAPIMIVGLACDLPEKRETVLPYRSLSLQIAMSFCLTTEACLGASSARAEDIESRGFVASERFSRDDKRRSLMAIARAVARLI